MAGAYQEPVLQVAGSKLHVQVAYANLKDESMC